MCGIVGYVGSAQALPIVMEGLRRLEYRGYDSAGIAVVDGGLSVRKRAGKLAELEALLIGEPAPPATIAIGHTRWATHGAPTEGNAHPHLDCDGRVAVIHNGIIENFQELRERLDKGGHAFASDTDTECVAHLLEEKVEGSASLAEAVRAAVGELEGSYALVVVSSDHPDELVGVKVSSPLVVAMWDD
ncbi:MAG: glutamine--fructose-6-phosphate aminotransferase, partial [Actinobacteria bacterium]